MLFSLNDLEVQDDTILIFGVRYPRSVSGRVYTYAAMKAGGRWYFTGSGRTPQDASWSAVQRWLDEDGREVVYVKVVTGVQDVWTFSSGNERSTPWPDPPLPEQHSYHQSGYAPKDVSPASQTRDDMENRLQ